MPQARATGNIHIGTIAGKLNGVMPATTPSGCINEKLSTPEPTLKEYSPLLRCGIPQANSTTSMPRVSSPSASDQTLPCSLTISAASSSRCFSSNTLNSKRIRARRSGVILLHAGKASCAL
ncbi:Uncharacterised protein [Salmonella enterica subsp. enterica serovar Bovismorbificans]|uniref:Uncharacterized protein n=1 Tax=Salmonella enterica subsp. enterica serovar Bovismorbificans TaxID=58097 RepID=A0A655DEU1_SALET|nr:Uncharacterised protein [Salmonella enterica subsp. enterica serovar Bovismorbificans]